MSTRSNGRRRSGVRWLFGVTGYLASLAAVAALVTGVTYGLFSATVSSDPNTFTAGTVSLTSDVTGACGISNLLPNGTPHTCTLTATYAGTVNAYMALDVLIETQHAGGGTNLYNPVQPTKDLQVAISSTNPAVGSYTVPTVPTSCPAGAPSGSMCYELDDELVNTTPITSFNGAVTFTTTLIVPTSSTSDYQGGGAQVILTAHAAQAGNNIASGCTAGDPCSTVSWG